MLAMDLPASRCDHCGCDDAQVGRFSWTHPAAYGQEAASSPHWSVASLARLKTRQRAEEERLYRTVSPFAEPLPARVVPMTPRPAEAPAALPAAEAPELQLVTTAAPGVTSTGPTPETRGSGAQKKAAEGAPAPSTEPDGQGVS